MTDTTSSARTDLLEEVIRSAVSADGIEPALAELYYRHASDEALRDHSPRALLEAVRSHIALSSGRAPGRAAVSIADPDPDGGWPAGRTIIQIVTDDMPFLVDSVLAELSSLDLSVHVLVHPQVATDGGPESWIHLEVDRIDGAAARDHVGDRLRIVLADVSGAVEDWPAMRARCRTIIDEITAHPPVGPDAADVALTTSFLTWLLDDNFTFVGYREYLLDTSGMPANIRAVGGTGLGLLRADPGRGREVVELSPEAAEKAEEQRLLVITKANTRSTVHRRAYLDYISVRTFDDSGVVTGERRFLGLFTVNAYTESINRIPLVRDKVDRVLAMSGFSESGHSGKALLGILETYPRDELFQASEKHLLEVALAVGHVEERRDVKVFLRPDDFGRFMSCLVYIPRDRFSTAIRHQMEARLREIFNATSVDYELRVTESSLARLHFVIRVPLGQPLPTVHAAELEDELRTVTRTWSEDLDVALAGERALLARYGAAFPASYQEDFDATRAVDDIRHLEALDGDAATGLSLYAAEPASEQERRLKLYRRRPVALTDILPMFDHFGLDVSDERPYTIHLPQGDIVHIYDLGLRAQSAESWTVGGWEALRERFHDAVTAILDGRAESDGFDALVLGAGLTWRQVVVLRAVAKYLRQTGVPFGQAYLQSTFAGNPRLSALLVELFETRFDPARFAGAPGATRASAEQAIVDRIETELDAVSSLDQDRILRAVLGVIRAMVRTNHYQRSADGRPKAQLAVKLDPSAVPNLPEPRPLHEIWVYSPRFEGVHLRFGPVARGGLRWSDRRDDFRTEVLGLVKTQTVKNAVIVPTGAKGGFVAKQLPDPAVDRAAWLDEGKACYRGFVEGLLDLTDNRVGAEIVPPPDVVRHDPDDPYLVVAADKGTAAFSDLANAVSQDYDYWLDDAFASGGSAGYDHKEMGITARGAWESVRRHFRELGVNTQAEEITVVGIGDMSGDVFGNGMLRSRRIRLIAAFDHRHVFIDPEPDAARSFTERRRLFELPRSSWADYDGSLISEGGGVFARTLKSIEITPEMAHALDLPHGVTAMTPTELIHAALQAPVDLIYNGGIGTYVKASTEDNADIGDRANDGIRVNGHEVRARVIGEGGNLGLSQLGRVEAALHGVRLNTDAIDNSAGVDSSDHEVNIKILLAPMVREGEMTRDRRNILLESMTDDVADHVLRDNYDQNVLLGNARSLKGTMLGVHRRFIQWLEDRGEIDRAIEFLPTDAELDQRHREDLGLTSPELAILVAYSKISLKHELAASALADDPHLQSVLAEYFPPALAEGHADRLAAHPLRREIIVNSVANAMVNRGGITFAFRAIEETGAAPEQIARAFVVAREVFAMADYVAAVETLDGVISTEVSSRLYVEFRRLIDRAVRWLVTSRPARLDIASEVARFGPFVAELGPRVADLLTGSEARAMEQRAADLVAEGVPAPLARYSACILDQFSLLDIIDVANDTGLAPDEVARVYHLVSDEFGIDNLLTRVSRLPHEDKWAGLARGALREDLYAVLEGLTRSVIDASDERPLDPAAAHRRWADDMATALQRVRSSLAAIDALDEPDVAALSVALRALRSLVRSGSATT